MQKQPISMIFAAACLAAVALLSWRVGADSAESFTRAEPTAVAVVNVERALNELTELEDKNGALADRVAARQTELDVLIKERQRLEEQLSLLNENDIEGRREIRAKLFEVTETAQARTAAYQSLINIEKGEIIRPLYIKLTEAVEEIAGKEGYDLVLFDDRGMVIPNEADRVVNQAIQQKRILFASASLDITDQIILLMNQKYAAGE